jgi:deoxyribodipyrimidine photolyase-related protein
MTNHQKPRLFLVLGDQLHPDPHPLLAQATTNDFVLMAEVPDESTHVWSHKARTALFFSAMRHFAAHQLSIGRAIDYWRIGTHECASLADVVRQFVATHPDVSTLCLLEPGDQRVRDVLQQCAKSLGLVCSITPDPHFLCGLDDFNQWAARSDKAGRDSLRMEFFYRWMRQRTGVLMQDGQPVGGQWNFDAENRKGFGAGGPPPVPQARRFAPDALTSEACADVDRYFPDHPGNLVSFGWPVTPQEALAALDDFIEHRLPAFGQWQDAMWQGEAFLWHSLISAAMNLKLLDPRVVLARAEAALASGAAPLAAVEGFIRQILGWREFVRGVYWRYGTQWQDVNFLEAQRPLPRWYWTGKTRAACLKEAISQTLTHGYAHHIQRLMVTGNFALLAGLNPRQVADWYLAVYVDAVDWVEEPNTLGMALFALGPRMTSKPYIASGAYIKRMSNACKQCVYKPDVRTGPKACPYTTLYWYFLMQHASWLRQNPRMAMAYKNLDRIPEAEQAAISEWAIVRLQTLETL